MTAGQNIHKKLHEPGVFTLMLSFKEELVGTAARFQQISHPYDVSKNAQKDLKITQNVQA